MQQLEIPIRPASINAHFFKDINDVCQVEGCGRTRSDGRIKSGLCAKHYVRQRKYGDVNADFRKPKSPPTKCAAPSCERMDILARGYCNQHYSRWRTYGDPEAPDRRSTVRREEPCVADGCDRGREVGDLCRMHNKRRLNHGDPNYTPPPRPTVCAVDGCSKAVKTGGYCGMHYGRARSNGDPLIIKRIHKYPAGATCSADDCDRHPKWDGLCPAHKWRKRTYGDPNASVRPSSYRGLSCSATGCDEPIIGWGLCKTHALPITRAVARQGARRRRARKIGAWVYNYTEAQVESRMAYWGHKCWMCGGPFECVDHVKPLKKGGRDCPANFRPACISCNSSKGAKWFGGRELYRFFK